MRPVDTVCSKKERQELSKKTLSELRSVAGLLGLSKEGTKKLLIDQIADACHYHKRMTPYCSGKSPFPMLFLPVNIWGLSMQALLDTASDTSLISYQWLEQAMQTRPAVKRAKYSDSCPATARGVGGKGVFKGQLAPVEMSIPLTSGGNSIQIEYPLMVMDHPIEQLILGVDFLLLTQAKIDLSTHSLEIDGSKIPLILRKLR